MALHALTVKLVLHLFVQHGPAVRVQSNAFNYLFGRTGSDKLWEVAAFG